MGRTFATHWSFDQSIWFEVLQILVVVEPYMQRKYEETQTSIYLDMQGLKTN